MLNKALIISLVVALGALAQDALTVDTPPSVVQCQPTRLTWRNGKAPYFVRLIPAGQIGATLETLLQDTSDTSYTWIVDQPAGTSLNVAVKDSTGAEQYSSIINVQAGSTTDCKNNSTQPSSGGGGGASASESGAGGGASASSASGSGTGGGAGASASSASATGGGGGAGASASSASGGAGASASSASGAVSASASSASASASAGAGSGAVVGAAAPGLAAAAIAVAAGALLL
ncbi:hypothetical protein Q8F55_000807 [Vanrija albida]|uniref:Uncharacterized protein n=1 Tax=Vanrija albida TaxID=181172 RepID=A0ABR3QF94_9TREE